MVLFRRLASDICSKMDHKIIGILVVFSIYSTGHCQPNGNSTTEEIVTVNTPPPILLNSTTSVQNISNVTSSLAATNTSLATHSQNSSNVGHLNSTTTSAPKDFSTVPVSSTRISLSTSATKNTSDNSGELPANGTPPAIFPSPSDPRYNFVDNVTAMQILTNKSEVGDLLTGGDFASMQPFTEEPAVENITEKDPVDFEGDDVELIEDSKAEDTRIVTKNEVPIVIQTDNDDDYDPSQGETAAILASVFAIFAVVAYIALLAWRRWLEKRYGNRELLIDDDDDMKHFSI